MDLSNLKGLLETNRMDSIEMSDNELEDELNAIISGHSVAAKTKPTATSSANVKRLKQNESKGTKSQMPSKFDKNLNENEIIISDGLLNIEKLGILEDSDDDIDENDEDLLSEISAIASKPSVERVFKSNEYKTPEIDYEFTSNYNHNDQKDLKSNLISEKIDHVPKNISQNVLDEPKPLPNLVPNIPKSHQNIKTPTNQMTETSGRVSTLSKTADKLSEIPRLNALKDQYKRAALSAKKSGQQTTALSHIKTAKQIEVLVKALEDGLTVDLTQLPPPPSIQMDSSADNSPQSHVESHSSAQSDINPDLGIDIDIQNIELTTEDAKKFFNAPPPPSTIMEALEQRLAKFKSTLEQANQENNAGKSRRLNRIVKQYENTIKDVKRGKTVDFDELPTPPGFAPIPVPNTSKPDNSSQQNSGLKLKIEPKTAGNGGMALNRSPQNAPKPQTALKPPTVPIDTTPPKTEQRPPLKRASSSASKQLNYLLERQRLFKEAALESKQKGDIQQAKEYLRMAKGFEPLIEATQNGLPIDATSIPTPPQMNEDFVIVSHPENSESEDLEKEELFRKIEVELQNQIEMCKRNKEYFLQLGDISTSSKFEKYAVDSRKDLDLLTIRWRNGQKLPNIKYETRTFSVVICNPEVGTNEVSVEIIKALDIPAKPDVDTYVRLEFPFPSDNHQTVRTKTVKNSINPVFNQTFKFDIDRKSRQLPRIFKRHPLKIELMSKGGFLRSDTLIGTVLIKLIDFENKCTIHESFQLAEGRKVTGGRIEAKVRIREPLLSKQVEEVKEKWLSFV